MRAVSVCTGNVVVFLFLFVLFPLSFYLVNLSLLVQTVGGVQTGYREDQTAVPCPQRLYLSLGILAPHVVCPSCLRLTGPDPRPAFHKTES
jgi:hypothetical protein